jgi:hypothetical protein
METHELSTIELGYRIRRALNKIILNETLDSFASAGVVLDEAGKFAIAELVVTDRSIRRRLSLRTWACPDIPTPPPDVRRWSCRKFNAVVDPRGGAIDSSGFRHGSVEDWFLKMASLGDDLPDFKHSPPPPERPS